MSAHNKEVGQSNHSITANPNATGSAYADVATMIADTDFNQDSSNVGKVLKVTSPLSFYILANITPTFTAIGGTSIDSPPVIINVQFTPEVDLIFYDGWVAQENITLTKGSLFAVTAPIGANIIVDILINGVAQSTPMTLTAGSTHELTDITNLEVTAGQRIGLKFTQIGSTNPGNGIIVTLYQVLT